MNEENARHKDMHGWLLGYNMRKSHRTSLASEFENIGAFVDWVNKNGWQEAVECLPGIGESLAEAMSQSMIDMGLKVPHFVRPKQLNAILTNGSYILLTPLQTKVYEFLFRHPGERFTRVQIEEELKLSKGVSSRCVNIFYRQGVAGISCEGNLVWSSKKSLPADVLLALAPRSDTTDLTDVYAQRIEALADTYEHPATDQVEAKGEELAKLRAQSISKAEQIEVLRSEMETIEAQSTVLEEKNLEISRFLHDAAFILEALAKKANLFGVDWPFALNPTIDESAEPPF